MPTPDPILAEAFARRIVPVVVINDDSNALPLADALIAGDLPVAEVTLRTPAALASIAAMSTRADLLVGAGTVLNVAQATAAMDAGARFLVSPGLSRDVVAAARERGVPVIPGAVTPTEIMAALDMGLGLLKFFPAGIYGGVAALKALGSVFGGVSFVPTGGVSPGNLAEFLAVPSVAAVGGSWMVPASAVDAGDFDTITQLCATAVAQAANN
ncbi:keto-deoxy-phosphogluconate aldolase [Tessaracoccus aquimaris]|uniref:Keto-deoxy-phosphogluconate aldolase n=1 Tax=Tessaracoccus aquimaris TaxID=1332264 RepID=A0A1Q2CKX4_9ACTN|nr:bifunctional 4-hydroxy-2-oxoglutarate aldolase/2-dehydro-3-deoxy-phosphogluconate aldolase [Tessaracoccus aquimaris]AQP46763.1 keto-deoxy-phosphogluconate aldolase [Tessaracoccus aquimaris]